MPRASMSTTEEDIIAPKKRAPRKRPVASSDASIAEDKPKRARKPRVPVVHEQERVHNTASESNNEPTRTERKAPTAIRGEREAHQRSSRALWGALVFFGIMFGVAAFIGFSDQGTIDVVAVVNERNERISRGEVRDGESATAVSTSIDERPNGGLVPAAVPTTPPTDTTVNEPATTASSSEATTTINGTTEQINDTATTEPVNEEANSETPSTDAS